ncbi:AAA family ATPase [Solirubrobacter phytolaccae]|uniref:AAA family ATPase n=1 Tax=Solirubrobacter phytolaccae TaxID=1404360 RepID=A0A9X3S604_9ACTN|nr:adenylate/guanylate cyclase domain-containing protein [Solirubrobacter phytolaccae]MDA0179509.1 AAA family ATPase [Solirubrobacter phytolaccae]
MASEHFAKQIESLWGDARHAHDDGDGERARALASAVLALDPEHAEARRLLDGSARRCQMTLMFCDLVGSTALSQTLDPEDMTEVLRGYRAICAQAVQRFGGFIEDRQGDGLLVRFGFPSVHEDDARRGVLGGLEIVRGVRAQREHGVELHVRVAVHTGMVVIDDGGVVGAAPNEASRLQTFAEPDTVLISEATHALVDGYFDVEARGVATLRDVLAPMRIYAVAGERADRRFDATGDLTPFTGRERERDVLVGAWRDAAEDDASPCVLVSGAAGIGKSRTIMEAARVAGTDVRLCPCSGYHQTTSLHAFRDVLEQACGIAEHDDTGRRLAKLRSAVDTADGDLPLLAAALSIPLEATVPQSEVDPSLLRTKAIGAAADLVRSAAAEAPVFLVVEDLHWADESTLELIGLLLAAPHPGLLIVLSGRERFQPPWDEAPLQRVELVPLSTGESQAMAVRLAGGAGLGADRLRALIARSDGIPLYLEELVRSSDVSDPRGLYPAIREPDPRIPSALRDSLLARLASPGVNLELAQIAATIGRDVDRELLQRVSELADSTFHTRLANLMAAGLVDGSGEHMIRFRHELIRVVAYETQRRAEARDRHSRIADLLGTTARPASRDAGEAAFHLEKAHRFDEAILAYVDAARAGQALGTHKEATTDLTHALGLIERLPAGRERLVTELTVRGLRSFSAVMARGFSAEEAMEDHARCVELCTELGGGPEQLSSLMLGWAYYCSQGDLVEADRVSDTIEQAIAAAGIALPAREVFKGTTRSFQGHLQEARELMEGGLAHAWSSPPGRTPEHWPMPNDLAVSVSGHLAVTRWIMGDPHGARLIGEQGLRRAATLPFPFGPFSKAYLDGCLALVQRLAGEHAVSLRHGQEMLATGERHGFALWSLVGWMHVSFDRVHLGELEALDAAVAAVEQWRIARASEVWTPYFLTALAAAQLHAGRAGEARVTLDEALAVAAATGSEFFASETLRLRGTLRWENGDPGGLEDLRHAVEKARRQRAAALQLRATVALEAANEFAAP